MRDCPLLAGEAYIIRYAVDFICGFENEADARRFKDVLPKRLARFYLTGDCWNQVKQQQ